ncbi:hypothetical protein [Microbacterium kribbense]
MTIECVPAGEALGRVAPPARMMPSIVALTVHLIRSQRRSA